MMHKNKKTSHKRIPRRQERPAWAATGLPALPGQEPVVASVRPPVPEAAGGTGELPVAETRRAISQAMPLSAVQGNAKGARRTDSAASRSSTRRRHSTAPHGSPGQGAACDGLNMDTSALSAQRSPPQRTPSPHFRQEVCATRYKGGCHQPSILVNVNQ